MNILFDFIACVSTEPMLPHLYMTHDWESTKLYPTEVDHVTVTCDLDYEVLFEAETQSLACLADGWDTGALQTCRKGNSYSNRIIHEITLF